MESNATYDYIIAGAGGAGLSLLYRILLDEKLNKKNILVLDQNPKNKNDRTWCYWEKENGLFDKIVRHKWKKLQFNTELFVNKFELKKYEYKMIRGLDFYEFVLQKAATFNNVSFRYETIEELSVKSNLAFAKTENGTYSATYLFNSTSLLHPVMDSSNSLLQHFVGWEIEAKEAVFDSKLGTLMDFSLEQKKGATFMYVLPVSQHRALVEYTLFSKVVLEKEEYIQELKSYILNKLSITDYTVKEEEQGVIPMSLAKFELHQGHRIINIGTAGGYTKASSGYTFQFIQKNTDQIVKRLKKGMTPIIKPTFREKMFQWYDRTLLEVLLKNKMTGKEVFASMFKKVPADYIFSFLANESSFKEEIKIMSSLPILKFLPAGIKKLFS